MRTIETVVYAGAGGCVFFEGPMLAPGAARAAVAVLRSWERRTSAPVWAAKALRAHGVRWEGNRDGSVVLTSRRRLTSRQRRVIRRNGWTP